MATTKKSKPKKSNIGMKAPKAHPLKLRASLASFKQINRQTLLAVVLLVVAIGGFIVYRSHAASVNTNDEAIEIFNINQHRRDIGLAQISNANCITGIARTWAQNMAAKNSLYHNPNLPAQLKNCGAWTWEGEIIDEVPISSCYSTSSTDYCNQMAFRTFMGSAEHKAIIEQGAPYSPTYFGAGAYRDDRGLLWVVVDFMKCSCGMGTSNVIDWSLTGSVTASSAGVARATNISVRPGAIVTWYHDVKNDGPFATVGPATYNVHVDGRHYGPNGGLIGSSSTDSATVNNPPTPSGGVYVVTDNVTIPSTAVSKEKYCRQIWFSAATGPSTVAGISPPNSKYPNQSSCVTVL